MIDDSNRQSIREALVRILFAASAARTTLDSEDREVLVQYGCGTISATK